MAWSIELQLLNDRLTHTLIARCREEVGNSRTVDAQGDPCRQLGICDEDLDDVQIDALRQFGLRPPYPGEPLIVPWHGPEKDMTIADLAAWLAVNSRPIDLP
ncbi:hypothetical protein FPZ54_06015 [Sphingomonas suaedae]|uniref:Uncharacterized protein n=1 Tax=Sphingomonas suaedae TaxID=2599297 RepID=A0A518RDR6_9SPHN|nr:hypothetical protein [Sphingomonas suaedae]QDX25617.1 hypothetical protein FPZ54_06015 [Sphingomonas suaedae]